MRLDQYDIEHFLRLQVELTARATKYFEARCQIFDQIVRHELAKIEFHSDGCTITYRKVSISTGFPIEGPEEIEVSIDDLLSFNDE